MEGAYIRRGFEEGNLRFKIDWTSLSSPEIGGKCLHSFAGNTRRSPAFEPLMYLVSVGSVLMEAKHDGIANEIVGARES